LPFGYFDRDFRLKAETIFFNGDRLNYFSPESLVTRFHVAKIDIGERIGEQS
jgi:hypothetical protein